MSQPFRRSISVMALGCLLVLLFLLAACGSDTTSSSATSDTHSGKQSVMTVTVKESKGADGKDVYTFDPTSITVKKGDTITIQNQSDELQDMDQGDAQKAGVDVKIPVNESATATFNTVGTFSLQSEKGATLTVTVN